VKVAKQRKKSTYMWEDLKVIQTSIIDDALTTVSWITEYTVVV
jgi:hypothetical protein